MHVGAGLSGKRLHLVFDESVNGTTLELMEIREKEMGFMPARPESSGKPAASPTPRLFLVQVAPGQPRTPSQSWRRPVAL